MIYYGNKCFTHAMSKHGGNVYQDKIVQFQMNYIISRPKFFLLITLYLRNSRFFKTVLKNYIERDIYSA